MTTKNIIEYSETDFFKKDFKKIKKKFKTLDEDFEIAKGTAIKLFHLYQIDNQGIVLVPGFKHEIIQIYKIRKFSSKSLKGRGVKSGIRVIYAYHPQQNHVNFLEIYFKADQENEDKDRIQSFLDELQ